jgi:hypothetical protein
VLPVIAHDAVDGRAAAALLMVDNARCSRAPDPHKLYMQPLMPAVFGCLASHNDQSAGAAVTETENEIYSEPINQSKIRGHRHT